MYSLFFLYGYTYGFLLHTIISRESYYRQVDKLHRKSMLWEENRKDSLSIDEYKEDYEKRRAAFEEVKLWLEQRLSMRFPTDDDFEERKTSLEEAERFLERLRKP